MFKRLADWFDARAGYRALIQKALEEPIPGGARWKYVWGAALAATFLIQLVTGLLLMLSYSPSSSTAWGSVFYINERMAGGWFIRGLHHFGSQAMVVLLVLHLLQVVWAGAYRAPRELNWWFGIALMVLTLGFCLTGYLLPWDQKGYWATKVATNIMGGAPVLGPYLQKVLVGGTHYGNQTLTHFYGLHVGILPILLVVCLAVHVALFRKHGVTAPRGARGMGHFWPEQLFRDTVAALTVYSILVFLVVREGGARLDAPADPSSANYPARPEWYFLALFQMLKLFPGKLEVVGTIIIPGAIMTVLLVLPLLDKILPTRLAHFLACSFIFTHIGGAGYLASAALREDAGDRQFQAARQRADQARDRALQLAKAPGVGIPPEGARYLLLRDPLYHGRDILEARCLGCHRYQGEGQSTLDDRGKETISPQKASDLKDFGTRAWVRGLLEDPGAATYFGKVPQCRGMMRWKKTSKLSAKELDAVADFVTAFAMIPPGTTPTEWVEDPKIANHPGLKPFLKECGQCHVVPELTEGGKEDAPNLFAWGSPQWIARMIKNPGTPDLYGFLKQSDRMVAFDGQLTDNDVTALVRLLKGDFLPQSMPTGIPIRFPRSQGGGTAASATSRPASPPAPSLPSAGAASPAPAEPADRADHQAGHVGPPGPGPVRWIRTATPGRPGRRVRPAASVRGRRTSAAAGGKRRRAPPGPCGSVSRSRLTVAAEPLLDVGTIPAPREERQAALEPLVSAGYVVVERDGSALAVTLVPD